MEEECNLLVYPCNLHPWDLHGRTHFVVDCEEHEYSVAERLFAGALGRALLHRGAAIR